MNEMAMAEYATARAAVHRVAVHVLARRRYEVVGRFGLRPTPGGFGTPLFGDPEHEEQVRLSAGVLVREQRDDAGPHTQIIPLAGATLRELADAVGVDVTTPFSVGTDTPGPEPIDAPLPDMAAAVSLMGSFLAMGAEALDRTLTRLGPEAAPIMAQVWPEHLDLGLDVGVGGQRVNLGASVGDGYHEAPYVYVGPWNAERPGDPAYWNVGFGALLGYDALAAAPDPVAATVAFFETGLDVLR